ncbi:MULTISPECIES: hypothetical protein [unclassified Rickettsia]|uniref:hypothetical protein n=1 Tax=unclassified Rickettsia TaxID=114295 RepID=UPI0031334496
MKSYIRIVIASDCKECGNPENNKFYSILLIFFLDCHVATLLAMTVFFVTILVYTILHRNDTTK